MKTPITISFSLLLFLNLSAQSLRKTFYDPWTRTKIKEEYYVNSKNQKNGTYIQYDDRGLKAVKIPFTNGRPNGTAYEYALPLIGYPGDEKVKKIAHYVNGEQQGKTSYYVYIKDGKQDIKEGTKILQGEEYYEHDKKVREIAYFINGKKQMDAYLYNGYQKKWYENNVLAIEFYVKDGVNNGSWKEWYDNGQIGVDGVRKDGKWFGEKKEWYANGKIKSINHFTEGDYYGELYEGEQDYYDSLGNKFKKEIYSPYVDNQQKISVEKYYSSSELRSKWTKIITGRSDPKVTYEGEYLTYYKNGQIAFGGNLNVKGNREGVWKRYDKNGNVIDELGYLDGYRIGKWKIYFDADWNEVNTKDRAEYYRNIEFDQKGQPLKNQTVRDYYSDGSIQFEGSLLSVDPDVLDGDCKFYYHNGNVKSEGKMYKGLKQGKWTDYNEDGTLQLVSEYAFIKGTNMSSYRPMDEVKTGLWTYYKNGNIDRVEVYDHDKLVQTKTGEEAEKEFVTQTKNSLTKKCSDLREEIKDVYVERVVLGDSYIDKTNKKKIYRAYDILMADYEEKITLSNNSQELLIVENEIMALSEKMKVLIHEETKELEKSLKKVENPDEIKKILGL